MLGTDLERDFLTATADSIGVYCLIFLDIYWTPELPSLSVLSLAWPYPFACSCSLNCLCGALTVIAVTSHGHARLVVLIQLYSKWWQILFIIFNYYVNTEVSLVGIQLLVIFVMHCYHYWSYPLTAPAFQLKREMYLLITQRTSSLRTPWRCCSTWSALYRWYMH